MSSPQAGREIYSGGSWQCDLVDAGVNGRCVGVWAALFSAEADFPGGGLFCCTVVEGQWSSGDRFWVVRFWGVFSLVFRWLLGSGCRGYGAARGGMATVLLWAATGAGSPGRGGVRDASFQ